MNMIGALCRLRRAIGLAGTYGLYKRIIRSMPVFCDKIKQNNKI
jgi:hypothetical protein